MDVPNIPELASELARIVGPYLPYLVETGKKAGDKVVGEVAFAGAKKVWGKLRGKVEEKPEAAEAVRDLAEDPEDSDLQAALRVQLKKILAVDSGLAEELAKLAQSVEIHGSGNAVAQVRGARNVVVQGRDNTVGGAGSYVAGRDLHIHTSSRKDSGRDFLRQIYLSWVMEQTGYLALSGVDRALKGSEQEARLSLEAVYTGLRTTEPRKNARREDAETLSALEQLDRHHRLVLLGAPGSGKSTFVNILALCMAGEISRSSTANLELLTAPLPIAQWEKDRKKETRQPWHHGRLLPVRIILRDFAAKRLPRPGEEATARHLWDFLKAELRDGGLPEYFPFLKNDLQEKGGLILLDGLDEVPEADTRRNQIRQAVESFVEGLGKDCHVLLTSRTYAYRNQDWALRGFEDAELAPFDSAQINRFVSRWYPHMAALGRVKAEEAEGRAERLKQAISNSERLQGLAERPLLLTLMASLHAWRGGSLPERREELYADAVELLLDSWERQRLRVNAKGEYELLQPSLAEWLKVDQQKVRQILDELAFEIHSSQVDSEGTADLSEEKLVGRLLHVSRNPDANPKQLVEYLSQRSGLLEARGVGVYSFPHRTFQEYLAACHLTGESFPKQVADLGRSGLGRWREVVLLAGGKAARGSTASVWQLVEALCWREADDPASDLADAWGAHLAGQVVVESANLAEIAEWNRPKLERLRSWLVRLLRDERLPVVERALAGESLARLGDPRPEVMTVDGMELREVPAGKFLMGNERYEMEILYTFQMARFPVTVAQFREAIKAGEAVFGNPWGFSQPTNQPMAAVTWHEAGWFCAWLTEKWREEERIKKDWEVRLPTEAEWEKAARGEDGREYPWGGEFETERANARETWVGRPSAVGCFPGGESPFHCEEMSGNVEEWTLSPLEGSGRHVLRGGSYFRGSRDVRCAYRRGYDPFYRVDGVGFRVVVAPFSSGL
jgi:formylglycine-generating enzyme required for sulfatase activity/energy-coupling factor transporter ATP-binding protein EcfA2